MFGALAVATAAILLLAMARILGGDGLGASDLILLACFAAMLPWNVIGFWNALIGFTILLGSRDPAARVLPALRTVAAAPIKGRLAIVMPVYNEAPGALFAILLRR